MSRHIDTGSTNQTIVFWAFDNNGDPVTLAHNSAGLSISYRVDANGREGTPVSLTPIARSVAGVHEDGAITSKGSGKHEVDLPDAAVSTADRIVTLEVSATSVTGSVYVETLEVSDAKATSTALTSTPAAVITLLGSGAEVYGHSYLEAIKRIEVVSGAATLSGAGTGTEVMTSADGSKTATFTVDGSGNVSAVVWS